jgi:hypothetical protein
MTRSVNHHRLGAVSADEVLDFLPDARILYDVTRRNDPPLKLSDTSLPARLAISTAALVPNQPARP